MNVIVVSSVSEHFLSGQKWYLSFEVFVNVHHRSVITYTNLGKRHALRKKKMEEEQHMQS